MVADARFRLGWGMKTRFDPQILIDLRRNNYWTQEDLSLASGVSTRTIQRIEREGGGSVETWKALAAAFDVDVSTLEMNGGGGLYTASEIRLGRLGLIFVSVWSVLGCLLPWGVVFLGWRQGDGFDVLLPFLIMAVFLTSMCTVIMVWGWQKFNRAASPS